MNNELHERHERFLTLLEGVRTALARYCRAISSDSEAARDLASETILVVYEHLDRIREPERFRSYCFRVASRLANRGRWRARNRVPYDPAIAEAIVDTGSSPDSGADVALLYAAISQLPGKMRDAVVLFEITGLSLEEIRLIQGGSLSGVKSRIVRARRRLAKLLGVEEASGNESVLPVGSDRPNRRSYSFARSNLESAPARPKATIL